MRRDLHGMAGVPGRLDLDRLRAVDGVPGHHRRPEPPRPGLRAGRRIRLLGDGQSDRTHRAGRCRPTGHRSGGRSVAERVLVTGAAGFIGSHLSRRLVADGFEVVGLDDLSDGSLDNLRDVPEIRFVQADLRDEAAVDRCRAWLHHDLPPGREARRPSLDGVPGGDHRRQRRRLAERLAGRPRGGCDGRRRVVLVGLRRPGRLPARRVDGAAAPLAVRGEQGDRGGLRRLLLALARRPVRVAPVLQRLRPRPGPGERVRGRGPAVHRRVPHRAGAGDLR